MNRVRLRFARGVEVKFADRDVAIRQLEELADRGTRFPLVVYGPEGCGKTSLLKQAVEVLKEHEYSVVYVSPLKEEAERLVTTDDLKGVVKKAWKEVVGNVVHPAAPALVDLALAVISRALRRGRRKVALLADDVFQAVSVDKAELLVKTMLNIIEYPPADYDSIVVIAMSSEGITRERIGRHRWAKMRVMWNMPKEGLRQLYEQLPGEKPPFEEVWRWTGGNPWILASLYESEWSLESVMRDLIHERKLQLFVESLNDVEREVLREALEDPDVILKRMREPEVQRLERRLVELNLVAEVWDREQHLWIDEPPPERDPKLGIGRYYAWQTPLHKEAVRLVLKR